MKPEERLFEALNGVDEALLDRSERKARGRRAPVLALGLTAAACLGLLFLPKALPSESSSTAGGAGAAASSPASSDDFGYGIATSPADDPSVVLPSAPDEGLTLHLLSQGTPEHAQVPAFLLYVNESIYRIAADGDGFVIRPVLPASELPACDLTIVHREKTAAEDEVRTQETALQAAYETVTRADIPAPDERVTLHADSGTDWDNPCCDVTVIPDGANGVFVLTARYFTEATEGHGVRFADMVMSFRPISDGTEQPGWLIDLQATANALMRELFAGEERDDLRAYGEDVRADLSIASVDYTIDDSQDPAHAVVSVRHRVNLEDSFNYLTIDLDYASGAWNAVFAGIEK